MRDNHEFSKSHTLDFQFERNIGFYQFRKLVQKKCKKKNAPKLCQITNMNKYYKLLFLYLVNTN